MLRYKLRTLLIVLAVGPPIAAVTWVAAPYVADWLISGLSQLLDISC